MSSEALFVEALLRLRRLVEYKKNARPYLQYGHFGGISVPVWFILKKKKGNKGRWVGVEFTNNYKILTPTYRLASTNK